MINIYEVNETNNMILNENLDVRTITMGINLLDCASSDLKTFNQKIYDKITKKAENLVKTGNDIAKEYGIPVVNKRISVTPIALAASAITSGSYVEIAKTLDRAAEAVGVNFIGGYSALVHKGMTPSDEKLIRSIPEALASTKSVCSSVNVGSTRTGINMDAVKLIEPETVINVGISGPGVIKAALEKVRGESFDVMSETIKKTAFKITRAGQLVANEAAKLLHTPFGIVDLSLAPTPAVGDSVARILEEMGLEVCGTHGTTAALAMLNDAVKKGGVMASSHVGGLSGAFIPVSEDEGMIAAVKSGGINLEKLEAMTCVCSVGLDMIAIPGDTDATTISAIIADEAAIGVINQKTTAVRLIPVHGKVLGDEVEFGGLLGTAPIMAVNKFSSADFVNRCGRFPAPIHSFKN